MYKIALASLADGGTLVEKDLALKAQALGLTDLFADPVIVSYDLNHTFGKVYAKVQARATVHLSCGRCNKAFDLGSCTRFPGPVRGQAGKGHDDRGRPG